MHGAPKAYPEAGQRDPVMFGLSARPHIPLARLATRQIVHIADVAAVRDPNDRDPRYLALLGAAAVRTILLVPMLKEEDILGAIVILRPVNRRVSEHVPRKQPLTELPAVPGQCRPASETEVRWLMSASRWWIQPWRVTCWVLSGLTGRFVSGVGPAVIPRPAWQPSLPAPETRSPWPPASCRLRIALRFRPLVQTLRHFRVLIVGELQWVTCWGSFWVLS
jgi:hypothetical protein